MYSARSDPCLIDSPSSKHFACYQAGLLKGLLCSLRSHESPSPYTFAQEGFCAHFVRTKALHRTLLHRKAFVLTSFARKPIKQGSGFPIQTSADQSLFASSPQLFAGYNVFRRL